MKRTVVLSIAIFSSGCALLRPLPADQNPELRDAPRSSSVVELPKDARVPSQIGRIYWAPQSRILKVTGARGAMFGFKLEIPHVHEWEDMRAIAPQATGLRTVASAPGDCRTWNCDEARPQNGSSSWSGFAKAGRGERVKIATGALRGLDAAEVEALVSAKWFTKAPTTWEELVAILERAIREKRVSAFGGQSAIVDFKERNLGALGYAMGSCGLKSFQCQLYRTDLVSSAVLEKKPQTLRQTKERQPRRFEVVVRAPHLQSFESESMTVVAGRDPDDVRVAVDGPTVYRMQMSHAGDVTRIEMTGVDRLRADLPVHALRSAVLDQESGDPRLHVSVDSRYLVNGADSDRLILRYEVQTCAAWGNVCSGDWVREIAKYVPVTGKDVNLPLQIERGRRAKALVSLARLNSKYYGDAFLRDRETDSIRVK